MGILTDYFRAPDAGAIVRAMEEETKQNLFDMGLLDDDPAEDEPSFGEGLDALERIDATGMHDDDLLPALIAAIMRVPPSRELVGQTLVWPTTRPAEPDELTGDDPWSTGPWVTEFDNAVRDTLANVNDAELPNVAARWARTDAVREFGAEPEVLREIVKRLARFARQARTNGEQLYCWVSL